MSLLGGKCSRNNKYEIASRRFNTKQQRTRWVFSLLALNRIGCCVQSYYIQSRGAFGFCVVCVCASVFVLQRP